jgi:hypothetical protein
LGFLASAVFVRFMTAHSAGSIVEVTVNVASGPPTVVRLTANAPGDFETTQHLEVPGLVTDAWVCVGLPPNLVVVELRRPDGDVEGCPNSDCTGDWGLAYSDSCGKCILRSSEGTESVYVHDGGPGETCLGTLAWADFALTHPVWVESVLFQLHEPGSHPNLTLHLFNAEGSEKQFSASFQGDAVFAETTGHLFPPMKVTRYRVSRSTLSGACVLRAEFFANPAAKAAQCE